jgi:hypothetical protein
MWGARGFAPVGYMGQTQLGGSFFNGALNGQGFTINALMLAPNNNTMQSIGLFGTIGAIGSVSNLNFTNASVAANIGSSSRSKGHRSRSGSASSPARAAAPSPT